MIKLISDLTIWVSLFLLGISLSAFISSLAGFPLVISRGFIVFNILICIYGPLGFGLDDMFVKFLQRFDESFTILEWYGFMTLSLIALILGIILCWL